MVKNPDKKGVVWSEKEGGELRRLRTVRGLTLKFCLEKVKKGKGAWNTWELGKNSPSASDIFVIETEVFGIQKGYFEKFSTSVDRVRLEPTPAKEQENPLLRSAYPLQAKKLQEVYDYLKIANDGDFALKLGETAEKAPEIGNWREGREQIKPWAKWVMHHNWEIDEKWWDQPEVTLQEHLARQLGADEKPSPAEARRKRLQQLLDIRELVEKTRMGLEREIEEEKTLN